jgi:homocysteine S-methyltransferase
MVTILDGGLSNALEDRGHDLSSALWTARILRDAPDEIAAVHRAYFAAGAQVATTASYQAPDELIGLSVRIARAACSQETHLVAASVGPYGAALADGSEYRGRYGVPAATLRDHHARRIAALVGAGPDLLAVETIPDVDEAEVLLPLLADAGLPSWFSYSVDGDRTRAGQPLAEAYDIFTGQPGIVAVGVNCARPADVLGAVQAAVAATGLPAVAYPNRGEEWDATSRTWVGTGGLDLGLAQTWVAAGASYVGGCCRVGPADIAALASGLAGA